MYALKLAFVFALTVGCLAELARGDALRKISQALMNRPGAEHSVQAFITAAESFLETQTKGVHLFNSETVGLLKTFIAAGKAIQDGDCSENSHELINSLPVKREDGYGSWQIALDVYKREHDTECSKRLQDSEKQLYPTLDQKQVDLISQLTKIAIPIVRGDDFFYQARLDTAGSVRYMSKHTQFLNRLHTDGSKKFTKELLGYLEKDGKQLPAIEAYKEYVVRPCHYYVEATSSIFEPQIHHYSDYGAENEEFNLHFLGYQLCRLFEKERSKIFNNLELEADLY